MESMIFFSILRPLLGIYVIYEVTRHILVYDMPSSVWKQKLLNNDEVYIRKIVEKLLLNLGASLIMLQRLIVITVIFRGSLLSFITHVIKMPPLIRVLIKWMLMIAISVERLSKKLNVRCLLPLRIHMFSRL